MSANNLIKLATIMCLVAFTALTVAHAQTAAATAAPAESALSRAEAALYGKLSSSSEPHERALAAWMVAATTEAARSDRRAALDFAAAALPRDAMLQWLAASVLDRCASSDASGGSLQLLQRLEPGNAAVGLLQVNRANVCRNQAGVASAFASMARGTRFDRHTDQIVRSWLSILLNDPAGKAVLRALPGDQASALDVAIRYAYNSEEARYQALMGGCRNPQHAAECARIGRLMAYQGKSLLDRQAGFAILQFTNNLRSDDLVRLRALHWLLQPKDALPLVGQTAYSKAILAGWIAGDEEAAIVGKALNAAGLSAAPPANWIDPDAPQKATPASPKPAATGN